MRAELHFMTVTLVIVGRIGGKKSLQDGGPVGRLWQS
jgi:hypothetical protein